MKLQRLVLLVLGLSVWMAGGCRAATIGIFAVQGNSDASPLQGQAVTVEGIVTGDFQGPKALRGFFIQDAVGDGDAATSDGVFVYVLAKNKKSKVDVSPGDRVRVSGTVSEYRGLTQIGDITTLESLGRAPLPVPVALELPLAEEAREKFEGMLVRFPQPLTISGSENLRSYGELSLAQGGRLFVPTNGQGGTAQGNAARRIILDDGSIRRSPQPVPYLASSGTRRAGDTVQDLVGVLSFSHGAFRVHPTQEPRFKDGNPRPTKPQAVGGTLRVASFNVENYFTTLKSQNAKARGATTPEEFARKTARLVATLKTLDADVLGLIEMENNGSKAVDFLTAQLNDAAGANTYAAVADPPGGAGTDLIKVAILYKPAKVQPVGAASALSLGVFDRFPIAQTFRATATPRARFSVVVNHFKSKSGPPKSGDVDAGQGAWNLKRTEQARALAGFISTIQAQSGDKDVLVLGDLNAYAAEDPIKVLEDAGLQSLEARLPIQERYSYIYGGQSGSLDHALAPPGLAAQVTGVAIWHINADEPRHKGGETAKATEVDSDLGEGQEEAEAKDGAAIDTSDESAATPFGVSDHDPLLIGLNLSETPGNAPIETAQAIAPPATALPAPVSYVPHVGLNATLWLQTAVEAQGASLQAYKLAALKLDQALRAPSWTASLEQAAAGAPSYARLPPAIVFDVDETVLSNAPYNAWMVLNNRSYDEATWRRWVEEARATAVPGALAFARYAQKKGVAVFYISNRGRAEEAGTARNLKRLGFPLSTRFDPILSRDEKPGWGSDKASRRRAVARTHRILLLIGDDFNDFVSGAKSLLPQRSKLHARYSHLWGEKWLVVPNPAYGSWDAALTPTEGVDKLARKYESLQSTQKSSRHVGP